jgi:hypothetical protein
MKIQLGKLTEVGKRQVTETGLLVSVLCLLAGFYYKETIWYQAALAGTLLTLVVPQFFYPLAIIWFAFGKLLSLVTSHVILVLLFILLVIPIALFRKGMGKDALKTKDFKKGQGSIFSDRQHTFQFSDLQYPF